MSTLGVEKSIRKDKQDLKLLQQAILSRTPIQQQELAYYQHAKARIKQKARRKAFQNLSIHIFAFIAAFSWERSLRDLFAKRSAFWKTNLGLSIGVTTLAVFLASRWAMAD